MKIIKTGEWKKRITCRGCKSVLEANGEDVRYGLYSTEYEDEFKGQFYIQCPVCDKKQIQKEIPNDVAADAMENRKD